MGNMATYALITGMSKKLMLCAEICLVDGSLHILVYHFQKVLIKESICFLLYNFIENTASAVSLVPQDVPIYRYSMCNGTENRFNKCQLPRSDNSTCPSIAAVNCSEGISTR